MWKYIIYHIGNNILHKYIYLTLKRYPGITVLHDYNIHSFVREISSTKGNNDTYFKELEGCYHTIGKLLSARINKEKSLGISWHLPNGKQKNARDLGIEVLKELTGDGIKK